MSKDSRTSPFHRVLARLVVGFVFGAGDLREGERSGGERTGIVASALTGAPISAPDRVHSSERSSRSYDSDYILGIVELLPELLGDAIVWPFCFVADVISVEAVLI